MIGDQLKRIRKLNGRTQKELANLSGVSAVYISNIESGIDYPSLNIITKICNALDYDIKLVKTTSEDLEIE